MPDFRAERFIEKCLALNSERGRVSAMKILDRFSQPMGFGADAVQEPIDNERDEYNPDDCDRSANHVDGYDRDDTGESPDF